jgi:hypothetical protein
MGLRGGMSAVSGCIDEAYEKHDDEKISLHRRQSQKRSSTMAILWKQKGMGIAASLATMDRWQRMRSSAP